MYIEITKQTNKPYVFIFAQSSFPQTKPEAPGNI